MDASPTLLRERFGFDEFRPGQAEVIGHLLAGRSAAAVFPTGGGKSICYQLPALLLPGLTLVVSPLIALMKDQIDRLVKMKIAAARLDSTLNAAEHRELMGRLRSGNLKLLYVAPERFVNERFREMIQRVRVSLFAVDEAHCISEWGHNFRPDYLKLVHFAKLCRTERTLALTATATPQVLKDICREFGIAPECAVRTGFYRPNLTLITTPIAAPDRDAALVERLRTRPAGPTIVYVTLQRTAELVATQLAAAGFQAQAYHAGMEDDARAAVQDWFIASDNAVVVATIAFGMGIDKSNIRYVYHYNVPKSLENLSQEIGRAGRDELPATCEIFVCPDDLIALENFAYGDTPGIESVRAMVQEVFAMGDEFDLSLYELSAKHDIRFLVARTLLTYLEIDGYIQEGTPYYSSFQFRPFATSAEILSQFEGERRDFLQRLFRSAVKAKVWFTIDLDRAISATDSDRERIVRALDYLAEKGLIELKAQGVRHRFRRMRRQPNLEELITALHARLLDREAREIARLGQVLELAAHDGCQVSKLGEYFGEPLQTPCGHCSWCLNGRPAVLLPRRAESIDEAIWSTATELRAQHPDPLAEPRAFARLLCGLTSPKLSRGRFTSLPLFGSLAALPFAEVLRRAQALEKGNTDLR
jgi:ATP-dependent DNA helicase RecQ